VFTAAFLESHSFIAPRNMALWQVAERNAALEEVQKQARELGVPELTKATMKQTIEWCQQTRTYLASKDPLEQTLLSFCLLLYTTKLPACLRAEESTMRGYVHSNAPWKALEMFVNTSKHCAVTKICKGVSAEPITSYVDMEQLKKSKKQVNRLSLLGEPQSKRRRTGEEKKQEKKGSASVVYDRAWCRERVWQSTPPRPPLKEVVDTLVQTFLSKVSISESHKHSKHLRLMELHSTSWTTHGANFHGYHSETVARELRRRGFYVVHVPHVDPPLLTISMG